MISIFKGGPLVFNVLRATMSISISLLQFSDCAVELPLTTPFLTTFFDTSTHLILMSSKYTKIATNDPFADGNDDFQIDDEDIVISPDTNDFNPSTTTSSLPKYNNDMPLPSIPSIPQISSKKTYEGGIFSLNYYRQYFDLNTKDFFSNCLKSMNVLSKPSADEFNQLGDLYGSIWITASLIFLLFFCNSFTSLLAGWFLGIDTGSLQINYFKMIVSSINLLYGYTFIIPLILHLVLKFYFKVIFLAPLTKLISIYSYANLLWIPAALLSIFRGFLVNHQSLDTILKWLCICFGVILSGTSILFKLKVYLSTIFRDDENKFMIACMLLLLLAHIGFAIGVKICFFGKL